MFIEFTNFSRHLQTWNHDNPMPLCEEHTGPEEQGYFSYADKISQFDESMFIHKNPSERSMSSAAMLTQSTDPNSQETMWRRMGSLQASYSESELQLSSEQHAWNSPSVHTRKRKNSIFQNIGLSPTFSLSQSLYDLADQQKRLEQDQELESMQENVQRQQRQKNSPKFTQDSVDSVYPEKALQDGNNTSDSISNWPLFPLTPTLIPMNEDADAVHLDCKITIPYRQNAKVHLIEKNTPSFLSSLMESVPTSPDDGMANTLDWLVGEGMKSLSEP
jgi:hypothetical protein